MGQIVILCLLICDVLKTHYHFQGIPTQKNPIKLKQNENIKLKLRIIPQYKCQCPKNQRLRNYSQLKEGT